MIIKDFQIKGQAPRYEVHATIEDHGQSNNLNLGHYEYVATLDSSELSKLIAKTYYESQTPGLSPAMNDLRGQSVESATSSSS